VAVVDFFVNVKPSAGKRICNNAQCFAGLSTMENHSLAKANAGRFTPGRFHLFASNEDTKQKLKPHVAPDFWPKIRVTYTCVNPDEIDRALEAPFDRKTMGQYAGRAAAC